MRRDIFGRLEASLHRARFIDLGIRDDPLAIDLWGYYNPESRLDYAGVLDAYAQCGRRLLLLGSPGSGKTTALLHLAARLVEDAETRADAPVPIIFNLSKFRLKQAASNRTIFGRRSHRDKGLEPESAPRKLFESWLISEITRHRKLSRAVARSWLAEGRLAVLLDGLDEFNDDQRPKLVRLLNRTFLRDYPDLPVVVCSRTNEYRELQGLPEGKLQLQGCACLEPLTEEQITQYLKAANASHLLDALPNDAALHELARVPLTLSMLVLAYGDTPLDYNSSSTLSERRHDLFQAYVSRMLQRQARRERDVPFDSFAVNDVPTSEYRYRPEKIDRWLGWLALTISVRMRTGFSPNTFFQILFLGIQSERSLLTFCSVYWSLGSVLSPGLLLLALPLMPLESRSFVALGSLATVSCAILPLVAAGEDDKPVGVPFFAVVSVLGGLLGVAIAASLLAAAFPGFLDIWSCCAVVCGVAFLAFVLYEGGFDLLTFLSSALFFAPMFVWMLGGNWMFGSETAKHFDPFVAWACVALSLAPSSFDPEKPQEILMVAPLIAVAMGVISLVFKLFVSYVDALNWLSLVVAFGCIIMHLLVSSDPDIGVVFAFLLTLSTITGALVAAEPGAVAAFVITVGIAACYSGLLQTYAVFGLRGEHPVPEFLKKRWNVAYRLLDRLLLGRCAWALLAASGRLPFRRASFLDFATRAFLLKQSAGELEFVHRLLRDFFALRELLPRAKGGEREARLTAIRSLGYQGEAALELLVDLSDDGSPAVRAAALSALTHIASPVATECIRRHVGDRSPEVRRVVLGELLPIFPSDLDPLGDGSEVEVIVHHRAKQASLGLHTNLEPGLVDFIRRSGQPGLNALVKGLSSRSRWESVESARLLGIVGDSTTVQPLIACLRSWRRDLRRVAAHALGALKDLRAVAPLTDLMRDWDASVRATARSATKEIQSVEIVTRILVRRDLPLGALRATVGSDSDGVAVCRRFAESVFDAFRQSKNNGDVAWRDALLDELRALAASYPDDPAMREWLAKGLFEARDHARDEKDTGRRDALLEELRVLTTAHPDDAIVRDWLAEGLFNTAYYAKREGDLIRRDALLDELCALAHAHPDDTGVRVAFAMCLFNTLNQVNGEGELERRDELLGELRALAAAYPGDANVREGLAMGLFNSLYYADAEGRFERRDALLDELRALAAAHPDDGSVRKRLVNSLPDALNHARNKGDLERRDELLGELRALAAAHPSDPALGGRFAEGLLTVLKQVGGEGDLVRRNALRALTDADPTNVALRERLAKSLLSALSHAADEEHLARRDALLGELRALAVAHPDETVVREQLAKGLVSILEDARSTGSLVRCRMLLHELRGLVAAHPGDKVVRRCFNMGHSITENNHKDTL